MTCAQYADYAQGEIEKLDKSCNTAEDCFMGLSYECMPFCVNGDVNMREFLSNLPVKRPETCPLFQCMLPELECACQNNECVLVPIEKECEIDSDCADSGIVSQCPVVCEEGKCKATDCGSIGRKCESDSDCLGKHEECPEMACAEPEITCENGECACTCPEEPTVSITTGKEEYEKGETVKITVSPSGPGLWAKMNYYCGQGQKPDLFILKKEGKEWLELTPWKHREWTHDCPESLPVAYPTPCHQWIELQETEFEWNQEYCHVQNAFSEDGNIEKMTAESEEYKARVCYYECEECEEEKCIETEFSITDSELKAECCEECVKAAETTWAIDDPFKKECEELQEYTPRGVTHEISPKCLEFFEGNPYTAEDCNGTKRCVEAGLAILNISSGPVRGGYVLECCEGLGVITAKQYFNEDCNEIMAPPGSNAVICSDCGNGVCEEWESECNCPEDCPRVTIKTDKEEYEQGEEIRYSFDAGVYLEVNDVYPNRKPHVVYREEKGEWISLFTFCTPYYACADCADYNNCEDCSNLPAYGEPAVEITNSCLKMETATARSWDSKYCETSEFECAWPSGQKAAHSCYNGLKEAEPGKYKIEAWYYLDENCEGEQLKATSNEFIIGYPPD